MSESIPVCKLDLYRQLNLPLPNAGCGGQIENEECKKQGPVRCKRAMGGNEGPICKRDILKQMGLPIPGEEPAPCDMDIVVASMEQEVRAMQTELSSVQAERRQLEMQKRLLHCAAPAITENASKGVKEFKPVIPHQIETAEKSTEITKEKIPLGGEEVELKYLETEYDKLLQNFNKKVEEISALRLELGEARRQSDASLKKFEQAEARAEDLEERLKAFEDEDIMAASNKDKMIELMQQLAMAERMFEKSFDEHETLRKKSITQTLQTDEFRRKYLDTEQCAEEQRHTLEILDSDRTRFGFEVTTELKNIKSQFQTKLQELTLLPDLINKTNEKLKEIEDLKTKVEKNCVVLSMSLDDAIEEKEAFQEELDMLNKKRNMSEAEKSFQTDSEKKMEETKEENKNLKLTIARLEEIVVINERKYEESFEEGRDLQLQLETLRQQSARQISKAKDRFDNTRHTLQDQIADLEKKLASTRASQKTAFQERDMIRRSMQSQIGDLNKNLKHAQRRIRSIQSHINYMRTSCTSSGSLDKDDQQILFHA